MVNLNAKQEKALQEVVNAHAEYKQAIEAFELSVAMRREELKQPIRTAVSLAESAGVPAMRIYNAMGYSQPTPYLRFMKVDHRAPAVAPASNFVPTQTFEEFKAANQVVGPHEVGLTEDEEIDEKIWVTDTFGNSAGAVYVSPTSLGTVMITKVKGAHTDNEIIKAKLAEYATENYPEYEIDWR